MAASFTASGRTRRFLDPDSRGRRAIAGLLQVVAEEHRARRARARGEDRPESWHHLSRHPRRLDGFVTLDDIPRGITAAGVTARSPRSIRATSPVSGMNGRSRPARRRAAAGSRQHRSCGTTFSTSRDRTTTRGRSTRAPAVRSGPIAAICPPTSPTARRRR
jgi:hypothetical protein